MTPFTENIIFIDTEFSSLNPYKGEILSIALVKLNGEELYLELQHNGEVDDWPKKHILPTLTQEKNSREKAVKEIQKFVGDTRPHLVAYVNTFDMIYLYKLFGLQECNELFHWLPVDFASMLFAQNIDPESLVDWSNENKFLEELKIDTSKYRQHNALDDAKLLREVYLRINSI